MIQNKKNSGLIVAGTALLIMIASHEGTRSKPYRDVTGIWTVCNGITGEGVDPTKTYSAGECKTLLASRVAIAGRAVLSCVKVPLNQPQYNSFTDLTYNIGGGAFCRSSIVTELNLGHYTEACNRIMLYNKAGGVVVNGLNTRRAEEKKLCLSKAA